MDVLELSSSTNSKNIADNENKIDTKINGDPNGEHFLLCGKYLNKCFHIVSELLETDLNTPEFEGLWDTTINYKIPRINENYHIKNKNASKMEQVYLFNINLI